MIHEYFFTKRSQTILKHFFDKTIARVEFRSGYPPATPGQKPKAYRYDACLNSYRATQTAAQT